MQVTIDERKKKRPDFKTGEIVKSNRAKENVVMVLEEDSKKSALFKGLVLSSDSNRNSGQVIDDFIKGAFDPFHGEITIRV